MSEYERFMKHNKKPCDESLKSKDLKDEDFKRYNSIPNFDFLNDPSSLENSSNPHTKEELERIIQLASEIDCSQVIRYLEEQNRKNRHYNRAIFWFTLIACLGTIIGIREDLSLIVSDIISFFAN